MRRLGRRRWMFRRGQSSTGYAMPLAQSVDMGTTSMPGPQAGTPGQIPVMMPMNRCGDGQLTGQEQCDDGNQIDTDGCRNNCQTSQCGDGVRRTDLAMGAPGYEACDDGNTVSGDGCSFTCALEQGWNCVAEVGTNRSACTSNCGDGQVVGAEQCDDGNTEDGDGCSAACQREMLCGNMRVDVGEGATKRQTIAQTVWCRSPRH